MKPTEPTEDKPNDTTPFEPTDTSSRPEATQFDQPSTNTQNVTNQPNDVASSNLSDSQSPTPSSNDNTGVDNHPDATVPSGVTTSNDESALSASHNKPKRSSKKLLITIALAVLAAVVLGGGAIFAYFNVVVPNQPENILKTSVLNTLESDVISFDGTMQLSSDNPDSIPATKVKFLSQSDVKNNASSATIDVIVSGVDISIDARVLDDNIYIKFGDLTTLKGLITAQFASFAIVADYDMTAIDDLIDTAGGILSEQWILIDSTLIDQAGASCVMDSQYTLTEKDRTILQEQFEKNPFITIDKHSDDTVAGVNSIKYELTIDNKKGAEYARSIENLSIFTAAKECDINKEVADTEVSGEELLKSDTTKLTVWADKDAKRLNKILFDDITIGAEDDDEVTFNLVSELRYDSFTVEKPADARPAVQVMSDLSGLFIQAWTKFQAER